MSAATTTPNRRVSMAQLRREGFTLSQIQRLRALRESYPISEMVASKQDLRRLELLRWMRRNGRLED